MNVKQIKNASQLASNSLKTLKTTKKLLGKAWKSLEAHKDLATPAPTASLSFSALAQA